MAQVEITKASLSPEVMDDRLTEDDVTCLQNIWREAIEDKRPGVAPEPVFRRLREKFAAVQDARC